MRRLLTFIAVTTFLVSSQAFGESIDVTFDNIKSLLENRNAKIQAAALEKAAAEDRQGSLARSFLPKVEVYGAQESFKTGTASRKTQPTAGAGVEVNPFNGGRDKIESDIRDLSADGKMAQTKRVLSEELQASRILFWEILYSQEQILLLERMLKVNSQNLAAAERRIRSGVATQSDRFEFEMKAVDLNRELAEVRVNFEAQKREFSILIGVDQNSTLNFPKAMVHTHDLDANLDIGVKPYDFLLKEGEVEAQKGELLAKSQRRVWIPKLDAYAAYNTYNERIASAGVGTPEDMRDEVVVGLKVSLSLPNGFESNRQASALDKEAQASKALVGYNRNLIENQLQSEIVKLKLLHDQVHDAEENIDRAEKYYKFTQSDYSRGVKNSPDVLGASEKLFETRTRRIQIIREFQTAKAKVFAKIGK